MPASTFNWKVPAGRALEAALNRALALDPETRDALRPLDGHAVVLQLEAPPLALQVRVNGERVEVGPVDGAREADLSVRSTLGGLIAQLPWFKRDDAPPVGKVKMSGDAELARRLQRLAERFDPDWQLPFVHVFGDVAGVQVAKAVGAALRQARIVGRNVAESAAEYLTEESRDVVGKAELHAFHDDVDALRDDVERLVARVGRLRRGAGA
jgi:ubiquinone biosynthesis protein UbiJ